MSRTFVTQKTQVFKSELYTDTLSIGSTLSSSSGNLEDDLNALRSLVKLHLLGSTGSVGNWYDDITAPTSGSVAGAITGSKRGITNLNQGLYNAENKNFLYRTEVLVPVTVSGSQNWIVLGPGEAPTNTAAVSDTVLGTVGARLTGALGSFQLDAVTGPNSISPKNLVLVVSSSTGDVIRSVTNNNRQVFGLLQFSSSVGDGTNLAALNKAQISFVTEDTAGTTLTACPVADIAGKTVFYSYPVRTTFTNVDEGAFVTGDGFRDFSAMANITLAQVVANQGNTPFTQSNNIEWAIAKNSHLAFMSGATSLFRLDPGATNVATMNIDTFNINNTNTVNFAKGASFNTSSNFINVGVTNGQIDASAELTVKAVSDLLLSGNQVTFADAFNAGSTYTGNLPLATSSGDWTSYKTEFGNVSILAAFDRLYNSVQGVTSTGKRKATGTAVLTSSVNASVNVSTNSAHQNLSGALPSLSGLAMDAQVVVYLNGVRQFTGQNNDVVAGNTLADGDLIFAQALRSGSIIQVDTYF